MLPQRSSYPPRGLLRHDISVVGARDFQIEGFELFHEVEERFSEQVWLTSKTGWKIHARLPTPPPLPENGFLFERFVVSPDQRAILADRKIGSGINQVFAFVRTRGVLRYELMSMTSINDRVAQKYGRPRGSETVSSEDKGAEFIHFEMWLPNGREALLTCHYGERHSYLYDYAVTLDTQTGALRNYHQVSGEHSLGWPMQNDTEQYPQTRFRALTPSEVERMDYKQTCEAVREMYERRNYKSWNKVSRRQAAGEMWPTEYANLQLLLQHQALLEARRKRQR